MALHDDIPILLLVDVQRGFEDTACWGGGRNNENAEKICGQLLEQWRQRGLPVIHVRHSSTNPGSRLHASHPGFAFNPHVQPQDDETIITKSVNSAFIGTDLKERIDAIGSRTLVIVGLTSDHCVSTTARMAGNYGYDTYLVADAIATFDKVGMTGERYDGELIHQTALASLKDEFATIVDKAELLAMLKPPMTAPPA